MQLHATGQIFGREKELGWLHSTLDKVQGRYPVLEQVLYVQGAPQTGRTELGLNALRIAAARGVPAAMIDMDRQLPNRGIPFDHSPYPENKSDQTREGRYEGELGQVRLAGDIMYELVCAADSPSGRPVYDDQSRYSPEHAAWALGDYVDWLAGFLKKPLMLVIDNIDHAPSGTLEWLQTQILNNFLDPDSRRGQQHICVLTSRFHYKELPVNLDYQVIRRMHGSRLGPLTEAETAQEVRQYKRNPWDDDIDPGKIMKVSGGIPGLNLMVAYDGVGTAVKALDKVIPPEAAVARSLLPVLAALDGFNIPLLGQISAAVLPDKAPGLDDRKAITGILADLRTTGLVELGGKQPNQVIPEYKPTLTAALKELKSPADFQALCLALGYLNEDYQSSSPKHRESFRAEMGQVAQALRFYVDKAGFSLPDSVAPIFTRLQTAGK